MSTGSKRYFRLTFPGFTDILEEAETPFYGELPAVKMYFPAPCGQHELTYKGGLK